MHCITMLKERRNSWMIRMILTSLFFSLFLLSGTTGQARHARQTRNDRAILTRISNIETSLISDRLKMDSVQKELSGIKIRLDTLLSIVNNQGDRIRDLEQTKSTVYQAAPTTSPTKQTNTQGIRQAKDCWDLKTKYKTTQDGIYEIVTPDGHMMSLRCDMTTDGGGWTVFQRRGDGSVSFNQGWEKYRSFFGHLTGEYWMGNDFLYESTRNVDQSLRVNICDWDGTTKWAKYSQFSVGGASDKYRLHISGFRGTAGDALDRSGFPDYNLNGSFFSTHDRDNDKSSTSCASYYRSGWWFRKCFSANLNGLYQPEHSGNRWDGILWITWRFTHSFKGTEMKIRPSSATTSSTAHQQFSCPVI